MWDQERDFVHEKIEPLTEPAPGKKVITFSLPPLSDDPLPPRRKKAEPEEKLGLTDMSELNEEDYRDLSKTPRRRAREAALLLLFAVQGGGEWGIVEQILEDAGISEGNQQFCITLAKLADMEAAENDALMSSYARSWDVSRFSAIDRSILRLALAELNHCAPEDATIVMNEAIELAKKFGSDESAPFINGMLDNIYKSRIQKEQGDKE